MIRKLLIPAFALSAFISTGAQAEKHVWRTGEGFTVRMGDLDLESASGRASLVRRLDYVADVTCRNVAPRRSRSACAEAVFSQAVASAPTRIRSVIIIALQQEGALRLASR